MEEQSFAAEEDAAVVTLYASAEQILMAADIVEEDMVIPEWGDARIRVQGLTKDVQGQMRRRATRGGKIDQDYLEMLIFLAGVKQPKFEERNLRQLTQKAGGVVDRVNQKILELSGMLPKQLEEIQASFL